MKNSYELDYSGVFVVGVGSTAPVDSEQEGHDNEDVHSDVVLRLHITNDNDVYL